MQHNAELETHDDKNYGMMSIHCCQQNTACTGAGTFKIPRLRCFGNWGDAHTAAVLASHEANPTPTNRADLLRVVQPERNKRALSFTCCGCAENWTPRGTHHSSSMIYGSARAVSILCTRHRESLSHHPGELGNIPSPSEFGENGWLPPVLCPAFRKSSSGTYGFCNDK